MTRGLSKELLYISKANKERLEFLAYGAHLVNTTGNSIDALRTRATVDRLKLASTFLRQAKATFSFGPELSRTCISRSYYSMYHALRAATFLAHGGDDHEKHMTLPSNIPSDFPDRARWENELKNARYERNKADYDPYPEKPAAFAPTAESLLDIAAELIPVVRVYLKTKAA